MPSLRVKLKNPQNRFKDDKGNLLKPYEQYTLEDSERVRRAIKINLLEKLPNNDPEPPAAKRQDLNKKPETLPAPESEADSGKKKP